MTQFVGILSVISLELINIYSQHGAIESLGTQEKLAHLA